MKRILIFSGTTEGRTLAEGLAASQIPCKVCVATEYGREVMEEGGCVSLHTGRLSREEMAEMMCEEEFLAVVDATHPFAVEVSENIRDSAAKAQLPYLRLQRETGDASLAEGIFFVKSQEECCRLLSCMEGKILLTTGSKELHRYCRDQALRERLFVRVLPGEESIRICREQGILGRQVIAMQGPFSKELNEALLKQFDIRCLVTKESGETGGYPEKLEAAAALKIPVIVIENPESRAGTAGMSLQEVGKALETLTGTPIFLRKIEVVLAGIGMGDEGLVTAEVREAVKNADCLIGAKRLLSSLPKQWNLRAEQKSCYQASEMFSHLSRFGKASQKAKFLAVLLFSGDIGFYSGAKKVREAYDGWRKEMEAEGIQTQIRCCPGISSVSYLSAKTGINYQDAAILSLHGISSGVCPGKIQEEIGKVVAKAEREPKVFLLTSGLSDVKALGDALEKRGFHQVRMTLGYQLSYPEERIVTLAPEECRALKEEGLYTCILENPGCQSRPLSPGLPDAAFCRGRVPMTKEEVREISLCKLRIRKDSLCYDVGSGTGSIAVEMGRLSEEIKVYAIERNEEALALIRKNCEAFGLHNVAVVEGEAPEAMENLPTPTHAFIGGSGGRLKEILTALYRKNPNCRVVLNAVTLETIAEIQELQKAFPLEEEEILSVSVSRAKKMGRYRLMQAENPVYIMSFQFAGRSQP